MTDTEAVCDTLYRFAEGLDLRDWELYRSVFTDEIEIDYTSHRPGSAGTMPADDWVERGRARLSPLDATQHSMTNPRVILSEDDPDRATCMMYIQAQHILQRKNCNLCDRRISHFSQDLVDVILADPRFIHVLFKVCPHILLRIL